jgi:hypothetical protein
MSSAISPFDTSKGLPCHWNVLHFEHGVSKTAQSRFEPTDDFPCTVEPHIITMQGKRVHLPGLSSTVVSKGRAIPFLYRCRKSTFHLVLMATHSYHPIWKHAFLSNHLGADAAPVHLQTFSFASDQDTGHAYLLTRTVAAFGVVRGRSCQFCVCVRSRTFRPRVRPCSICPFPALLPRHRHSHSPASYASNTC